ncbi:MAG: hypothetical protein LBH75_06730 [Treponema sp.]|nr:hypothetical protein [Treponema sp.]
MKKIIKNEFFITILLVILTMVLASCDFSEFDIPNSVTIKGKPGVHIPLGSPFRGENENVIERYLGTDKILEMMGSSSDGEGASTLNTINIYEYAPAGADNQVKTFIVHYPIAKMPYDLSEHMNQVYKIQPPKITGIDLRRPAEVEKFFPGISLSALMNMNDADIERAIDDKIDEWVDKAAAGEKVETGISAADSRLNDLSTALNNPLLSDQQKSQLIAQTKTQIKDLPEVKTVKSDTVTLFDTLKSRVGELQQKIEVPLSDMAKLVKYIDVKNTGLKVEGTVFKDAVKIAIPQFGIGSDTETVQGVEKDGDLYFTTNSKDNADGDNNPSTHRFTLDPQEPNLIIHIEVIDFLDNGPVDFEPALEFEWTEASVDPGEQGTLTESYDMDFGNIESFMGDSFEAPEVWGYLYISDLPISRSKTGGGSGPTVSLQIEGSNPTDLIKEEPMNDTDLPEFPENGKKFTGKLLPASLDPINMTKVFTAGKGSSLKYTVKMGDANNPLILTNDSSFLEGVISADMVVVIPLEFKVKASPLTVEGTRYVPLELKDEKGESLLPKIEEDLFGRKKDGDGTIDEVIGSISNVTIKLEYLQNKALPNTAILIKSGAADHLLKLEDGSAPSLSLDNSEVEYPFTPSFQILIPCETGEDYGMLRLGREYNFDFNLIVEAIAGIDKTVDF